MRFGGSFPHLVIFQILVASFISSRTFTSPVSMLFMVGYEYCLDFPPL